MIINAYNEHITKQGDIFFNKKYVRKKINKNELPNVTRLQKVLQLKCEGKVREFRERFAKNSGRFNIFLSCIKFSLNREGIQRNHC